MLTEEESLSNSNTVDVDIDQENTMNTGTIRSSSVNTELVSCVSHGGAISSVVNNQNQDLTDSKNDISISNDHAVSILDNSNVAFAISSNESNLSHQRSLQSRKTENNISSTPKKFCKVKQHHSTSINLTKRKTLYCKMSIVFAILLTTGCSLIPIILYYANLAGNNVPIDPEYSQERNTSRAKVHTY